MGFFTVTANPRYQDRPPETAFLACKCFGNWTKALDGHKKGDTVRVWGRLRTETWGKKDAPQPQLVLVCESVQFMVLSAWNEPQMAGGPPPDNGESPADNGASDPKMPPF